MAVGGVGQHLVQNEFEALLPHRAGERVERRHAAHGRGHVVEGADVVAEILVRAGVDRRQPDRIDAEGADIVEPREDARQVAHPVAVAVAETAWVDLIDDRPFPPRRGHRRAQPISDMFETMCETMP
jgi:hypothetical protein